MTDETNKNETNFHQSSGNITSYNQIHNPVSFAKSFRASIQKVSNLYEQTSKIYSRIGDGGTLDEDEKLFNEDENKFKDKSKSLIEAG